MRDVQVLTDMIISILSNRKGFDDWFGSLDDSISDNIIDELDETIEEWLNMETSYEMENE